MHYVGLDLAWGERSPTGVAALRDDGELLHVSAQGDDEAVLAALGPYVDGPCLVAIDAPLVVANPTGNRPAEAALNKHYARFDAGAHPANTTKPELAGTPRARRLADRLGLDIDPSSTADRRAVEVYPHPATVALFRLGRTLKYKDKKGRTVQALREAMLELVGHVEGLRDASPPMRVRQHAGWRDLVAQVTTATRKSRLRHAEDQLDAVVCAYVAMFAHLRPELTTTYGDLATGYIVTPTLPPDLQPVPRARGAVDTAEAPKRGEAAAEVGPVRRAVQTYASRHLELRRTTDSVVDLVTRLLDDAGINYLGVTGRAKSVASFAAKADRTDTDGRPVYADPLREITDQIGVRVVTYLHSDVTAVAHLLADQLSVLDDRDMGQETAREGRFGYASRHLLVAAGQQGARELGDRQAQVQVRTVLQHAWAEFEHAIRYKGTIPAEHAPDLDRRFTLAAGLLELADREFSLIRDRLQATVTSAPDADPRDPRISGQELATYLAARYADAGWSREDHYAWVSGLLLELGITSLGELAGLLASVDSAAITERMGYRYPPGAVRRLDDALLAVFGTRYLALHGNAHRTDLLRARLDRIRAG